ncbi:cytochrome P450 52A3 [Scheffersomyces coipomensis]|uniref:cytochrome P450 52A3 n=1 Tax=Scheffersomyces coipomensis TaxID=1788519 RepID=UPI00315C4F34
MLRPQFARDQVAHVQALEPHIKVLAKHIKYSKGSTFDLQKLMFQLTVDTSTEFLFGESVHSLYSESIGLPPPNDIDGRNEFADSFNTAQHYLASRAYSQFMYFLINPKEFRDVTAVVHKVARYYVNRALKFSPEELEEKSKDGYVFLYELAKQTKDKKVLQDQLLNILVAGRDTTAGLLSFTFYELARNPDVFNKLRKEIEENFGVGEDADLSLITFESLKKCEYLKCVLNEILRLYPSVPINFRVATKDTVLPRGGGKENNEPLYVSKGTTVAYAAYVTHRLPEYYGKDADDFKPDRWINPPKLGWAYVPFNGGPRICLGQQFALTEASYVVVRLLQLFSKLDSKDEGPYPPRKMVHLTMCHQEGVFVQME